MGLDWGGDPQDPPWLRPCHGRLLEVLYKQTNTELVREDVAVGEAAVDGGVELGERRRNVEVA